MQLESGLEVEQSFSHSLRVRFMAMPDWRKLPGVVCRMSRAKVGNQTELATGLSVSSEEPIKAGIVNFNSDQTPRSRQSSYTAPGSILVQRATESPRASHLGTDSPRDSPRASLLGVRLQPLNVEKSDSSLLSPGNKKVPPDNHTVSALASGISF